MTDWLEAAACRDMPTEMLDAFYPERGKSIAVAASICAGCTVVRDCLISDLRQTRVHYASAGGARGGIGGLGRRRLIVALRDLDHPPERTCRDDDCDWCRQMDRHRTNLDVIAGDRPRSEHRRINGNGPGATHGKRSTFARGDRCPECKVAIYAPLRDGIDADPYLEEMFPGLPRGSMTDIEGEGVEHLVEAMKRTVKAMLQTEVAA